MLRRAGALRSVVIGNRIFFEREEIARFIASRRVHLTSESDSDRVDARSLVDRNADDPATRADTSRASGQRALAGQCARAVRGRKPPQVQVLKTAGTWPRRERRVQRTHMPPSSERAPTSADLLAVASGFAGSESKGRRHGSVSACALAISTISGRLITGLSTVRGHVFPTPDQVPSQSATAEAGGVEAAKAAAR